MQYTIVEKFISKNRPGTPLQFRGGVLHETGNLDRDCALNEYDYFNNNIVNASAHAFIDSNNIINTIPFGEIAWHAGRTANRQFFGIEMCHSEDRNKFDEIYKRSVWLFAHLFFKVALPRIYTVSSNNLMSHAEVSNTWKETDHVDPVDYLAKFGKSMNYFRADVQNCIDTMLFEKSVSNIKLIKSPEYWRQHCNSGSMVNGAWMQKVVMNFVDTFRMIDTFDDALKYLKLIGIVNTPSYWLSNAQEGLICDGGYARTLLINMGKFL